MGQIRDYRYETNLYYESLLDDLEKKLPEYCHTFVNGIRVRRAIRTIVGYCRDLVIFFSFLIKKNPLLKDCTTRDLPWDIIEKVTVFDIEEYVIYLQNYESNNKHFSNGEQALARKLSSLSVFYDYFVKRDMLQKNPVDCVDRPKIHTKKVIYLEPDQIDRLIDVVQSAEGLTDTQKKYHVYTVERDLAIILTLLGTGMRVSELVGLNLNDIDYYNNTMRVIRKGGNEDLVYFGDEVANALEIYLAATLDPPESITNLPSNGSNKISPRQRLLPYPDSPEPALFVSMRGKRISVRTIQVLVKKYSNIVIPNKKISPHKLRSTAGTMLYRETKDVYLIRDTLGHKSIATSEHYVDNSSNRENARDLLKNVHKI